jgi:aspartyl-tRNA(Asn)/glutamyl-tRNA(Gln) amidotransferase subunit C
MSLNPDEVRRIARLARLELSSAEVDQTISRLNSIFELIEHLKAADTRAVEPMAHAVDVSQRLRADQVTETDRHLDFQKLAPDTEGGLYLVPKVLE